MSSASLTGRTRVLSASITTTADVVEEDLQSPLWYIDTETGTLWRRDASVFDEISVVRPPKLVAGGVTVRF